MIAEISQQLKGCGTHYLLRYDNVTVSESLNGCWSHTCSGTTNHHGTLWHFS